jgi:hypothetical protein
MSVNLAYDLWNELKRFIGGADRTEAADSMVNLLIDNDISTIVPTTTKNTRKNMMTSTTMMKIINNVV